MSQISSAHEVPEGDLSSRLTRWLLSDPRLARDPNAEIGSAPAPMRPAAQYIRMSTDHQTYSPLRQREAIAAYALERGYTVVKTYADEGRSGLSVEGRMGLIALLDDVANGIGGFEVVLVYDISRWGRFQNTDEAAYYEFVCRRAGIGVEYCMEPFCNDSTPMAAVIKAVKRIMAGEYSRELSEKVSAGKRRQVRLGFLQGSTAGYGLRRMAIDSSGKPRGILQYGEQKFLQSDRVVLVPGPAKERRTVQWIFRQVVAKGRPKDIAEELNRRGVRCPNGRAWTYSGVIGLVSNEKYIGNIVYSRTTCRLTARPVKNPVDQWIRVEGAHPAIVDRALFMRAQAAMSRWSTRISDDEAIAALRELCRKHGRLSSKLIDSDKGMPDARWYAERFGTLLGAYKLAGFVPDHDFGHLPGHGWRRRGGETLREEVAAVLRSLGATALHEKKCGLLVNGRLRLRVRMARYLPSKGNLRCNVQVQSEPRPDWLLVAALGLDQAEIRDYHLVPGNKRWYLFGTPPERHPERFGATTVRPLIELLARPEGPPMIPARPRRVAATMYGQPRGNRRNHEPPGAPSSGPIGARRL